MFEWIAQNTLMAGGMALLVGAACVVLRPRPALAHALWALVLLRLVAPPVPAPVRVDALGAARGGAVAAAGYLEEQYARAFGDPEAAMRNEARKRRVTHAQFGAPAPEQARAEAEPTHAATITTVSGAPLVAPGPDLCEEAFAEMAFAAPAAEEAPVKSAAGAGGVGIRGWLGAIWIAGSAGALLWLGARALAFGRVVRSAAPADARLTQAVGAVAQRLGVSPPRVLMTDRLASPVVWAMGRPTLVWPAGGAGSALLQQSSVIAHELAHIRRRDHWMAWLELALLVGLWWNPVMWIARGQMRRSAEFACDAWAVSNFPQQRRIYAETLVAMCAGGPAPVGALALGTADCDRRTFERRLRLIMRGAGRHRTPRAAALAVGAASLLAVAPGWSVGRPSAALADEPVVVVEVDAAVAAPLRPAVERSILARKARRLFELEDWSHAAAAYQTLVDRFGADGEALSRLGAARLMEGQTAEAIEAFAAQCELNWRRDVGEFNLAAAHVRGGDLAAALRHLELAISIGFDEAEMLQTDPDLDPLRGSAAFAELEGRLRSAAALRRQAHQAMARQEWKQAVGLWRNLLELTPADARAVHLLGASQIAAGDPRSAIKSYQRLLDAGAMVTLAAYNTACAAALSGDCELAMASLRRAIDTGFRDVGLLAADGDLDALRGLEEFQAMQESLRARDRLVREAQLAAELGDWAQAAGAAEAALAVNPAHGSMWAGLGEARLALGDAPGAAEAFAQQVGLGADVASGLYGLARALAAQDRGAEALAHLSAAVEAGFNDGERLEADEALARLRADQQFARVKQSIADADVLGKFGAVDWWHLLERAQQHTERLPQDGRWRLRLGWAHLRLGEYKEAIAAFYEQERLGWAPGIARYNVACALALDGRPSEALAWLDASLEAGFIDPAHAAADVDLASLRGLAEFDAFLERARAMGMRRAEEGPDRMIY